jgi:hypothetical protein
VSRLDAPSGVPTGGVPPGGVLEEVDGTPIVPVAARPAVAGLSWRRGAAAALLLAAGRPALWLYALVAFLARGGLLVLALPIVVLPTFLGIANVVGPASVSAAGASPRLVALIAAGVAGMTVLVVVGTAIAAAAETALHRATVAPDPADAVEPAGPGGAPAHLGMPGADGTPAPDGQTERGGSFMVRAPAVGAGRATARVFALRVALLVPVVAVAALAVPAWVSVAYRELTLPSDVAAPLLLRVLAGAPLASSAVLIAWLGAEIVGGFATRRAVLFDASAARALGSAIVDPFRAPMGTTATVVVALGLSVLALVPGMWATGVAWSAARRILGGEIDAVAVLGIALALAAAWLAALVLSGIAAAARATLVTAELLRRDPAHAHGAVAATGGDAAASRHATAGPPVG